MRVRPICIIAFRWCSKEDQRKNAVVVAYFWVPFRRAVGKDIVVSQQKWCQYFISFLSRTVSGSLSLIAPLYKTLLLSLSLSLSDHITRYAIVSLALARGSPVCLCVCVRARRIASEVHLALACCGWEEKYQTPPSFGPFCSHQSRSSTRPIPKRARVRNCVLASWIESKMALETLFASVIWWDVRCTRKSMIF